jgi:hypothetical protein
MTQEQKAILHDWHMEQRSDGETVDDLLPTLAESHPKLVELILSPESNADDTDDNYISDNKACEMMEEAIKEEKLP